MASSTMRWSTGSALVNVVSPRRKKLSTPAAAIAANAGSTSLKTARVGSHQLKPEGARGVVQHFGIVTPTRVARVAEHANSGDLRCRLLQNLQALLLLVSTVERQARDVAGRADHVTHEL